MIWELLQPCINLGLAEKDFWEMTVAEIERYLNGAHWRLKSQSQFDYLLANLIGVSVARVISNEVQFPELEEVYPHLFKEEIEEKRKQEEAAKDEELAMINSQNRFLEFAMKHNAKMKELKK